MTGFVVAQVSSWKHISVSNQRLHCVFDGCSSVYEACKGCAILPIAVSVMTGFVVAQVRYMLLQGV